MTTASPTLPRLHGLDAMRAAMMLLGLVLHSATSYTATPLGATWPYQDGSTSAVFDWLVFIIHLFRMPAFFVMAGFFASFLYHRETPSGFVAHRLRRLLLPLAAGWVLTVPLIGMGFAYARARRDAIPFQEAVAQLEQITGTAPTLAHLWFLYYLCLFCLAAALLMPLIRRLPARVRVAVTTQFGVLAPTLTGCLICGLVTTVTLLPVPRVLAAYAVFFVFGWLLFVRRDVVASVGGRPWFFLGTGLGTCLIYMVVLAVHPFGEGTLAYHMTAILPAGIATWLLIYGLIGLFLRYCGEACPLQRYFADAAYWMYIVHLPLTIWIPGLLAPFTLPVIVKFAIVLAVTTCATVVTYHYFVRATAIGVFLNGRRFDRAWPRAADRATTA